MNEARSHQSAGEIRRQTADYVRRDRRFEKVNTDVVSREKPEVLVSAARVRTRIEQTNDSTS